MDAEVKKVDDDGNIGVRERYINSALRKKQVLNIHLKGDPVVEDGTMTMDPDSLVSKLIRKKGPYTSRYGEDRTYYVYVYKWNPNLTPDD